MIYCAYESNLTPDTMSFHCPDTKYIGTGKLYGWKLAFKYHADIVPADDGSYVPVVVWNIDRHDLESLDAYSGCPGYYASKIVDVTLDDDGRSICGFTYVMRSDCRGLEKPSDGYFDSLVEKYKENGMDVTCLYNALKECSRA